ncbi:sperm acrosome-associated protein 7 [Rattus rattus]|uniref:sperm acrosome-associated protein 7 n=1 Tax=Rattus rattus TaxID=10117 RepID=UPI0013F3264F|nr:sperm acrosome-associated protein 7 [Rattus rattus]
MAANRGARTFLSVFLLCCWQVTELHPVKTTSGPITEGVFNSTTENIPETLDEILAQDILEPRTSAMSATTRRTRSPAQTTVPTKEPNAGIEENYQEEAFENYHEFLENLEHSSRKKAKSDDNENKSSKDDVYEKLSVLDRMIENTGQSEDSLELTENIF